MGHLPVEGDRLFEAAMRNDWDSIKETFRNNPQSWGLKITTSEDTVLHFAVREGRRKEVMELIDLCLPGERMKILKLPNKRGNTLLHIAAEQGDAELCKYLLNESRKELIGQRNNDDETPLFVAALHGKTEVFIVLLKQLRPEGESKFPIETYHSRKDGNTILHVSILGEHFELAFRIIKVYQAQDTAAALVNRHNERGQSALHLLAKTPHAFRSGNHFGTFEHIIYSLLWIDRLDDDINDKTNYHRYGHYTGDGSQVLACPKNYQICSTIFELARKPIETIGKRCKSCDIFDAAEEGEAGISKGEGKRVNRIPPNYVTIVHLLKVAIEILLVLLGLGLWKISKIKERKERHTWAYQVMEELVRADPSSRYKADGGEPRRPDMDGGEGWKPPAELPDLETDQITPNKAPTEGITMSQSEANKVEKQTEDPKTATKTNAAQENAEAKAGVVEIVEKILEVFPVAIEDENKEGKNIVLLAAENRQPYVYLLLKTKFMKESVFQKVDNKGNCALHLASALGENMPWIIPGAALQMQWELKWYKFVKSTMRGHFYKRPNEDNKTAKEIFTSTHRELVTKGSEWLTKTSESCSVVAALIATVAFAAAVTFPGGFRQDEATPVLQGVPMFDLFAISSLVALCLSVTSLVMFLSILTSRHVAKDFEWSLPRKLIVGLTTLFFSIAAILLSFCAGHYFVLRNQLRHIAFTLYSASCLPVILFALAQLSLYWDLIRAILTPIPHRTYIETAY